MKPPRQAVTVDSCSEATEILLLGVHPELRQEAERHRSSCPRCGKAGRGYTPPTPPIWQTVSLFLLLLLQVSTALPWVFGYDPWQLTSLDQAHITRDGAIGVAVASAAGLVLWRPRHAQAAFVFGSAGVTLQTLVAMFDSTQEKLGVADELIHLVSIGLVVCIGLIALSMKVAPLSHRQVHDQTPLQIVKDSTD